MRFDGIFRLFFFSWESWFSVISKRPSGFKETNEDFTGNETSNIYHLHKYHSLLAPHSSTTQGTFLEKKKPSHFVIDRIRIRARDYGSNLSLTSVKLNHECWLSGSQELLQAFCHRLPEEADSLQISTAAGLAFSQGSSQPSAGWSSTPVCHFSHLKTNIREHCCSLKEQKEPVALLQLFSIPGMQLQPREQMFTPVESRRMDWWAELQFH